MHTIINESTVVMINRYARIKDNLYLQKHFSKTCSYERQQNSMVMFYVACVLINWKFILSQNPLKSENYNDYDYFCRFMPESFTKLSNGLNMSWAEQVELDQEDSRFVFKI